jgi:hypothetical protein
LKRFLAAAAVAALWAWAAHHTPWWAAWACVWTSACAAWLALAYAIDRPRLLGKLDAPRLAAVLLFPFLASARRAARLAQRLGFPERSEVAPGLSLGGWPRRGPSAFAHLDCTAELPRSATPLAYRCVPMLDGVGMAPADLRTAVEQVEAWRAEGLPVLVFCAYGHGRSVTVMVALLVRAGLFSDIDPALAHLRTLRPRAHLTPPQRAVLAETLRDCAR